MEPMKFRPIVVDDSGQELTQHGTEEFPMSMDKQLVSHKNCQRIPHWHYEVQIGLVIQGSVWFNTSAGNFLVQKGEGIFINSGVTHEVEPTEAKDSIYICVNFHPNLIYGQSNNMIRRDYVDPLLFNADLQAFALKDTPWHQEICNLLQELGRINNAQEYGYEIMMKVILCRIWNLILVNNREKIEQKASISFSDKQRMKLLQNFIHQHYSDRLTLADIAAAGHISRGECCRIFHRVLKMSPMSYLMKHRIAQSIKLLTCTEMNITEISRQTGFSSSSYYTECFKAEMGMTPLKYRKQKAAPPM